MFAIRSPFQTMQERDRVATEAKAGLDAKRKAEVEANLKVEGAANVQAERQVREKAAAEKAIEDKRQEVRFVSFYAMAWHYAFFLLE